MTGAGATGLSCVTSLLLNLCGDALVGPGPVAKLFEVGDENFPSYRPKSPIQLLVVHTSHADCYSFDPVGRLWPVSWWCPSFPQRPAGVSSYSRLGEGTLGQHRPPEELRRHAAFTSVDLLSDRHDADVALRQPRLDADAICQGRGATHDEVRLDPMVSVHDPQLCLDRKEAIVVDTDSQLIIANGS